MVLIPIISLSHDHKNAVKDFTLLNIDGKKVSLSDYKNQKGVILIFNCNTCPFSVLYEDRINDLDTKYKAKGYPVVVINPNNPKAKKGEDYESMKKRALAKKFSFPYLFDEKLSVYKQYHATRTPEVFILQNNGGKFYIQYHGAIDDNAKNAAKVKTKYVENALADLMAGNNVKVKETKAIGCSIKK